MRRKVCKWFWAWEFEKEEEWLNGMAAKGLALTSVGYCKYEFEDSLPGEYTVRLEMLNNWPSHAESQRYIQFIEETGAEQVGSIMRWVYFRKKKTDGEFTLFSDTDSRIAHLNRVLALLTPLTVMNIWIGIYNIVLRFTIHAPTINLLSGIVSELVSLLLLCGILRIWKVRRKLKKERLLRE